MLKRALEKGGLEMLARGLLRAIFRSVSAGDRVRCAFS